MAGDIASLVGSSWLLGERLSGGVEITYHGRRGYHLQVTRGDGAAHAGPTMFYPADAIVDAETGSLLRLIAYNGDAPAEWWELDDVTTEPGDAADPAGFRPHIPPGTRVVEESGHPLVDATTGIPGLTGTAARAAAEAYPHGAAPSPPPAASWTTCAAIASALATNVHRLGYAALGTLAWPVLPARLTTDGS